MIGQNSKLHVSDYISVCKFAIDTNSPEMLLFLLLELYFFFEKSIEKCIYSSQILIYTHIKEI